MYGFHNQYLKLLLPAIIEFIKSIVSLNAELGYAADKVLAGLHIFFGLISTALGSVLAVFLGVILLCLRAWMWAEDGGRT